MKKLLLLFCLFLLSGAGHLVRAQALGERPGAAEERSIVVFPNPSTGGVLHVTVTGFEGKTDLRILNIIGNVVYRESLNESEARFSRTLDLSELTPGLYYLKLEGEGRSEMRKVVIR